MAAGRDIGSIPPRKTDKAAQLYPFCLDHIRMFNSQWNYYDGLKGTRWARNQKGHNLGQQAGNLAHLRLQNWPVLIRLRINLPSLTRLTPGVRSQNLTTQQKKPLPCLS